MSSITLYDTARSYGYGESEALLGEFFRSGESAQPSGNLDEVRILPAAARVEAARESRWRRRWFTAVPALRGVAQRQAAGQLVQGEFSGDLLRTSLETRSLRALKTDYVDLL